MADETDAIEDLPEDQKKKSGGNSWMPIIVVVVLLPILSFVMAEFVFIPRLQKAMGAGHGETHGEAHNDELPTIMTGGPGAPPSTGGGDPHGGSKKDSKKSPGIQLYSFDTMKTNLANPSTTLIIVKFSVQGTDPHFMDVIGQYQVPLTDATLKVLSLLTRIDTQSPGIQNVVKNDLITRFNQVLGKPLVEELYFTDFITQ